MDKSERSKQIYVLKAFAIFSVVCAHMTLTLEQGSNGLLSNRIIGVYGTIGVAAFFICSGYYYHRQKRDFIAFWENKCLKIIIPWILCSILTYILNILLQGTSWNLIGQLKWTMGYLTWYYFVPVLLFQYIWFKISQNNTMLFISVILSIISNILTISKIWWVTDYITPYMNPFNWMLFFALGILWKRTEQKYNTLTQSKLFPFLCSLIFVGCFAIGVLDGSEISYWNTFSVLLELTGTFCLLAISWKLRNIKLLQSIGKNTFFIYLIHLQIVGAINTRLPHNAFIQLIKAFIGLGIVYCLLLLIRFIAKKIHLERLLWLLGFPENK